MSGGAGARRSFETGGHTGTMGWTVLDDLVMGPQDLRVVLGSKRDNWGNSRGL